MAGLFPRAVQGIHCFFTAREMRIAKGRGLLRRDVPHIYKAVECLTALVYPDIQYEKSLIQSVFTVPLCRPLVAYPKENDYCEYKGTHTGVVVRNPT
jgi:hypothetical protein